MGERIGKPLIEVISVPDRIPDTATPQPAVVPVEPYVEPDEVPAPEKIATPEREKIPA